MRSRDEEPFPLPTECLVPGVVSNAQILLDRSLPFQNYSLALADSITPYFIHLVKSIAQNLRHMGEREVSE